MRYIAFVSDPLFNLAWVGMDHIGFGRERQKPE